ELARRGRLAEIYLSMAEPGRARAVMEERRAAAWQDVNAAIVLGRALQATGDIAGAAAAFRRSLALQPQQAEGWYRLGRLALAQGRTEEARDALFHALVVSRTYPGCAFYTGMTYLQQNRPGDLDRAISFFKDALALNGNDAPAQYQYGAALERSDRRKEALPRYSMAILADMLYPEPNLALGRGMLATGDARDGHRYL